MVLILIVSKKKHICVKTIALGEFMNVVFASGIKHVLCPDSGDLVVIVTEDTAVHIVSLNTWTVKFKLSNVLRR